MSAPRQADPVSLSAFASIPEGEGQFAPEFCRANGALKLAESGDSIVLGFAEKVRREVVASVAKLSGKQVEAFLVDHAEFASWLGRRLGSEEGGAAPSSDDGGIPLDVLANDAPVVNLVNSVLIDAVRAGASDVHLESSAEGALVRFRVDGVLAVDRRISRERFLGVSARIKIMANLNVMERRLPQDGRLGVDSGGKSLDLRVSIVPTRHGESIVLRLLGRAREPLELTALGMSEDQLDATRKLLGRPHGLVLVTGPTGSGKTTTLAAMMGALRSETRKIVSIEDPVEYVLEGVNQIQVNERIQLGFDTILRRVLRQDPDVVMVGEIRDHSTAELVVRAAMTGHLVLSTLHTNDAVSAVARLRNLGVEPYLVAGVLRAAYAQRLVRKLCPACARRISASPARRALAATFGVTLEETAEAKGCPLCRGSGYAGRFAVFERFEFDADLEELVASGARSSALREALDARGMVGIRKAALCRVAAFDTSFEEAEREVGFV